MKGKTLLLLRHGKSDWSTGHEDFHRPLVGRGRRGSQRMGAWIKEQKLLPDLVVSSPAERARATAAAACKAMGIALPKVRWDARIYAAPLEDLLAALADCPASAKCVLLVGHNPGLEELLEYLVADRLEIPADGKLLPTSALARMQVLADWQQLARGCARLISLTRPGQLKEDAPGEAGEAAHSALAPDAPDAPASADAADAPASGNAPGAGKAADRSPAPRSDPSGPVPDHFYTQSAALPYRLAGGKLEILVISSNKSARWVIPKGVKEADLSLRDSACKEAFEEAGVRGRIEDEAIGRYAYEKWDGVCSVEVFAMAVEESVPEAQWQESHRERRWVSPKEARRLLDEPALRKLVGKLAERFEK